LIGQLFGWGRLARHYLTREPFTGIKRHFRSGKIGLSNYSGCLTVGTNSEGLYLAVVFLFRPGHPPLFIPWGDVTARVKESWLAGPRLQLRFSRAPRVVLYVSKRLGETIAADANRSWADDPPVT
jgi:hypothetical protein